MMQRCQDQRIDLCELKRHIVKKIGVERSKRYFYYLSRFLSQKLTKSEFDKTCFRLLGRENLSLHNQLIRSILRNATVYKSPPPLHLTKHVANGPEQSGSLVPNQSDPVCSNGVRSGMRKRKMRDSPVGSNGNVVCREDNNGGSLSRSDHRRPGGYGDADERDGEFLRPIAKPKRPCKEQVAAAALRDDDDENQEGLVRVNLSASSPLVAPLGITTFCSASVGGGSRRMVPVSTDGGLLQDTEMLRKRMENIAAAHGLEGVSMECANTLNTLLDVYLKKLIKSCIDLVGARRQDQHYVSLLDFRTAMELNPRQLGEDWPSLRERISMRSFEEQDSEVRKHVG